MLKCILLCLAILCSLYASTITEIDVENVQKELKEAFAVCLKYPLKQPTSTPSISEADLKIPVYYLFGDGVAKVLRKKDTAKPQNIFDIAKAKLPAILAKSTFKPLQLLLKDGAQIYKKIISDLSKISQVQTEMNAKINQQERIKTSYDTMVQSQKEFRKIFPSLRAKIIFTKTSKNDFKILLEGFRQDLDIFNYCVEINSLDKFATDDINYVKYNATLSAWNKLAAVTNSLNSFIDSNIEYFDNWKFFISIVNNWSESVASLEESIEDILGENTKDSELKNIHETVPYAIAHLSKEIDELEVKKKQEEKKVTTVFNGKPAVIIMKKYGSFQNYIVHLVQLAINDLFEEKAMKENFELSANGGSESVKIALIAGSVLLLGTCVFVVVILIVKNKERMNLKRKEIAKENEFFYNL